MQSGFGDQQLHGYYSALLVREGDVVKILEETVNIAVNITILSRGRAKRPLNLAATFISSKASASAVGRLADIADPANPLPQMRIDAVGVISVAKCFGGLITSGSFIRRTRPWLFGHNKIASWSRVCHLCAARVKSFIASEAKEYGKGIRNDRISSSGCPDRACRTSDHAADGRESASDPPTLRARHFSERRSCNDTGRLRVRTARPSRGKNAGGRHDAWTGWRLLLGGGRGLQRHDTFKASPANGGISGRSRAILPFSWIASVRAAIRKVFHVSATTPGPTRSTKSRFARSTRMVRLPGFANAMM